MTDLYFSTMMHEFEDMPVHCRLTDYALRFLNKNYDEGDDDDDKDDSKDDNGA